MDSNTEQYRSFLKIDKHNLDEEIIRQPSLYYEISEIYATLVSQRDAAYENIKIVDADTGLAVRELLETEGKKPTEALVASMVQDSEQHKSAHHKYIDLKRQSDEMGALKDAFSQRSYMLRDLVQLYISGYYMDTTVRATGDGVPNAEHQLARSKIREKIKRA